MSSLNFLFTNYNPDEEGVEEATEEDLNLVLKYYMETQPKTNWLLELIQSRVGWMMGNLVPSR